LKGGSLPLPKPLKQGYSRVVRGWKRSGGGVSSPQEKQREGKSKEAGKGAGGRTETGRRQSRRGLKTLKKGGCYPNGLTAREKERKHRR